MSNQLTHPSLKSGITRRTALRGAAWTAPAITMVVAAPAFAATSDTPAQTGPVGWVRNGTLLTANTSLTSSTAVTGINCLVTLTFNGGNGVAISTTSVPSPWIAGANTSTTAQFQLASLGAGSAVAFQPTFDLTNVSYTSITWTFSYTWSGGGSATMGGTYVK